MALSEDPERNEVAALAEVVPSFAGLHVLEVGCGNGRLTRRYAAGAASVTAIDPDEDDIAQLWQALPGVDARAISFEELEMPAGSMDVVLFAWSL